MRTMRDDFWKVISAVAMLAAFAAWMALGAVAPL